MRPVTHGQTVTADIGLPGCSTILTSYRASTSTRRRFAFGAIRICSV